jgi:hypothetical protein
MKPHADADRLAKLFPAVRKYQELATKHGIEDIFQDNGSKPSRRTVARPAKMIA